LGTTNIASFKINGEMMGDEEMKKIFSFLLAASK